MDISDIAKLAGVSPSTVSKVINHKDGSISAATRERVLKIVREYHYTPYSRSRATKDWLIGVVFRSPISLDSTLDGILAIAQDAGYAPLVLNSNLDLEQERKTSRRSRARARRASSGSPSASRACRSGPSSTSRARRS